jgi:peptidoglycan/LPS O-acetylase OafA/YrhL
MDLAVRALIKYLLGLILVSVFLFVPAGTLLFPNAWLFIALLFLPMLFVGTALYLKAPALLEKRINVREKEKTQKNVVKIMALVFIAGFVMAGLDHRLSLSAPPSICVIIASVLLIASYALYAEVMRENAYLSRTVEVSS